MSARSDPATPLVTPRDADQPDQSGLKRRPPELNVPTPPSVLRPSGSSTTPRLSTPSGKGLLVEIGDGWARCTPGDGGRPYYWHRKKDVKQFDIPKLATEVLDKQLLRAAGEGDAKLMDELLKRGAKVDAADPAGTTPTMKASAMGNVKCLNLLLSYKPNLKATNSQGRTALHIAAFWGRIGFGTDSGCIGLLMRAGADAAARVVGSEEGMTAIQLACIGLLGEGSSPNGLSPRTPRISTTPRSGSRVAVPGSPAGSPAIKKTDVELLLSVGPDKYSAIKQDQIDAANAKLAAAKAREMEKQLASNALRRFQSSPNDAPRPKPPTVPKKLVRVVTVDESTSWKAAEEQRQAERKRVEEQRQAERKRVEEEEKRRADATTIIQKHIRGALTRMSSKTLIRERRAEVLLERLAIAARRLEAGEELDEAELQQLAGDVAEMLRLLKEMPKLADLIRKLSGVDALDVLRKAKRFVKLKTKRGNKVTASALETITKYLRDELENLSANELVQRAEAHGVDPAAIGIAMNTDDICEQAAQLTNLVISAIETAASISGEDLLGAIAAALRAELARLPQNELVRRARVLGIHRQPLSRALASSDAQAQLASLIVDRLIQSAGGSFSTHLEGKLSDDLAGQIQELLAENVETSALDALLIVEPERTLAALQKDKGAAMVIQRYARGKAARMKVQERVAQLRTAECRRAAALRSHEAAVCIQQHVRLQQVRKKATAKRKLRLDCALRVLRQAVRVKLKGMRKRKERLIHQWAATKIQAVRRGHEARVLLQQLREEGVEVWLVSAHTRAARDWFERFSGMSVAKCSWLRRDQLHRLIIELRSTHGLPVVDSVVEREVREMLDGSFDGVSSRAQGRTYHNKLSFARWLQIVRAAEQRRVPRSAPRTVNPKIPPPGWSVRPRWALEYPQIRGGDMVFPKMDRAGRYVEQNRYYPVGLGLSGREIPCVGAVHAPAVMRKPLANALWTWCGDSSHFVHYNR